MTKQEFLNKWGIDEFYVMTNNDFKQTLLILAVARNELNSSKRLIM